MTQKNPLPFNGKTGINARSSSSATRLHLTGPVTSQGGKYECLLIIPSFWWPKYQTIGAPSEKRTHLWRAPDFGVTFGACVIKPRNMNWSQQLASITIAITLGVLWSGKYFQMNHKPASINPVLFTPDMFTSLHWEKKKPWLQLFTSPKTH